jgi:hypothetical protein
MDDEPEDAYLSNVAGADIYVGILGTRYGKPLKSGYSATHAEYNEAIRRGLRISIWTASDGIDGRQLDLLEEVRVFHTTGSYESPDHLAHQIEERLRVVAAESLAPWVKIGPAVFRANSVADDGHQIIVRARLRDAAVVASLESWRPGQPYGQQATTRLTWPGGTSSVRVTGVHVETASANAKTVTVTADRVPDEGAHRFDVSFESRSPDDLTELAMRVALFGEPNPLGNMGFMADARNPIPEIEQLSLSEDAFGQVAQLLITEELVGHKGVERITTFRLGPRQRGVRRIRVGWMPRRRTVNDEPVERAIEGSLAAGGQPAAEGRR